jgi:hypothetical protein
MVSTDEVNPYPDGIEVRVRYPRSKAEEQADREQWPWLPEVIQRRCQGWPPEWQVIVLAPRTGGRRRVPAGLPG